MTADTGLDWGSPDESAVVCDRCGRPFATETLLALHRGQVHFDDLSEAERAAYEAAYEDEQGTIRRFRLKALGSLILVYFGFLIVYALV